MKSSLTHPLPWNSSCTNNRKQNAKCGGGIWFGENHPLNWAIRIPGDEQSNQTGELAALVVALQLTDPITPLCCISDSRYVIDGLTKNLRDWEDKGWTGIANKKWFQAAMYQLHWKAAPTYFKWTKGHSGKHGNEQANHLANIGANKEEPDNIDISVPDNFNIQGMKLLTATQALVHAALVLPKTTTHTNTTVNNLILIRNALQNTTSNLETNSTIWSSIQNPDISKPIQSFLFCATHNSLCIGRYWHHIKNLEHREKCPQCNAITENLEHILIHCTSTEMNTIWNLASSLCQSSNIPWPQISLRLILGCGAIKPTTETPPGWWTTEQACTQLLHILISESAHLIWVIRCKQVITAKHYTPEEITTRWLGKINTQLNIDRRWVIIQRDKTLTNRIKLTWEPTLHQRTNLPPNWVKTLEVLVGIRLPRPSNSTWPR